MLKRTLLMLAQGVAVGGLAISGTAHGQLFSMQDLAEGYRVAAATDDSRNQSVKQQTDKQFSEGKCGEGRCGGMKSMPEGACGNMALDREGMVMNENTDRLPRGCSEITDDIDITVQAGTRYADPNRGHVFGYDQHEWTVPGCSRLTVTFINEDQVRHQWMVHGLPEDIYPEGMFHLEANGGFQKTGTFIVPARNFTYLVHCDMAQHTEKGLKAQLKVGKGRGNLHSIPGISAQRYRDPVDSNPDRYR